MPKKTGKKDQIRIKLEGELLKKFESLKQYYGTEANTELVRSLINDKLLRETNREATSCRYGDVIHHV